ncbi:hypothetical protein SAMN05421788_106226 [Filimonas lacunae]|uniref:Uncharacterized protein n=1 Tax=Filimonas lacunae TaxID=477680 RepID=A0A1N7QQ16_9BACT|nr:hypothetical protein SAMN05421788_106226 [Filimonas lacunae]
MSFIVILLCLFGPLYGQKGFPAGKVVAVPAPRYFSSAVPEVVYADTLSTDTAGSSRYLMPYTRQLGKPGFSSYIPVSARGNVSTINNNAGNKNPQIATVPAITIHGNVLYSVDYRSYIDTPYAEHDIYYHTVQTYLDITYKNNYPFRVFLTNRFSNSLLTRKLTDLNMQFSAADFASRLRQIMNRYPLPKLPGDSLGMIEHQLDAKRDELLQLRSWSNSPGVVQKLIEAKETALYGSKPELAADSIPALPAVAFSRPDAPDRKKIPGYLKDWFSRRSDSSAVSQKPAVDTSFMQTYQTRKRRIDTLEQQVQQLEKRYQHHKQQVAAWQQQRNNELYKSSSGTQQLDAEIAARQVPDSALPAGYQTLLAIKTLGVGRTVVDYSELSVKNVSINGLQIEYNPSYYVAVAAGSIDYRFRDFIVKNASAPAQYLYMVRAGKGLKNGTNIIVSWYAGKKQVYNNTGSNSGTQPDYHLMGFTLEGNCRVNASTYLTAEVAKSSVPYYNNGTNKSLLASAVHLGEHANEAYSLKLQTIIPASTTRITAYFKRYGASFQSFSYITTGTQQKAWMIKADQPFFKNQLLVTASLKENDYTNTTTNITYQNNTVFKSIQATLRLRRWPVFSLGYYPSSQLTKLSDSAYVENLFYSLVGSASYYYKVDGVDMSTTALYTRFYNKPSDSAFVYSNTSTFLLSHALLYAKFTWQTTGSASLAAMYNLYTVDNAAQYALLNWLRVGAGIKYNYQTYYNSIQIGYKGNVLIKMKKLGEVQLMMEKGFIPGSNRQLVENNTGRFSYFKIF